MVKAKRKPLPELTQVIRPYRNILNIGCGGCVSVCLAGGQKEVNVLNAELSLEVGKGVRIDGYTIERQCRPLYVDEIKEIVKQYDCLLSMACGAGVQLLAETSGRNIVVSDTVQGNVTLRLRNVPWDQALDIILKTKGLAMRQTGNVMLVAPSEEIAAREKLELEAQKQIEELEPLYVACLPLYERLTEFTIGN